MGKKTKQFYSTMHSLFLEHDKNLAAGVVVYEAQIASACSCCLSVTVSQSISVLNGCVKKKRTNIAPDCPNCMFADC